jgi:hypothetical protein
MAAFSSFHFIESGAPSRRAPVTSTPCVTTLRTTGPAEIAARVRAAAGKAVLLLWTVLALGFSLLVMVGFVSAASGT